jgi:hypothetical protein
MPGPRLPRLPLWLGPPLVMALAGAGLWPAGGLLGSPRAEVWGHAWALSWRAAALPAWPEGPGELLLFARPWPVMDPLPTALGAALTRLLGLEVGWNALVLAGVGLAFAGGAALARRAGGDPWTGGLGLALAPSLMGAAASGLSEDLWVGLAALTFADLGHRDPRRGARAGLWLGLLAGCGLLLAWATGLAAALGGLALALRREGRGPGLLRAALIAGAGAAAAALPHADRLQGAGHRLGAALERVEPLWPVNPTRAADLASLLRPGPVELGDALVRLHPGYLGLSLLGLTLLGLLPWGLPRALAARTAQPSSAPPARAPALLLLLLLGAAALSLGPTIAWTGQPTGLPGPAALLPLLPLGGLVNHHGRLLLLAAVALSALGARGAARLGRLGPAAALLVAADLARLSPLPLPLPVADLRPAGVYADPLDGLPEGAVLELPAGGPGVHPQRGLLDQRAHGRPWARDPNVPGVPAALARGEARDALEAVGRPGAAPLRVWPAGVGLIVVREPFVAEAEAALGPPDRRAADSALWARPDAALSPRGAARGAAAADPLGPGASAGPAAPRR